MQDQEMTLTEHLTELRNRMVVVIVAVGVLFLGGFFVSKPVLHWLMVRAHIPRIVVIGVPEAFFALLKVDLVMSLVVASPLIIYEVSAFLLPAMTPSERKVVAMIAGPGLVLFLAGMSVGLLVFVPIILKVMLSFVGHGLTELWSLNNYLSFITYLTVPFGFVAEFPLVAGVLTHVGIIEPNLLKKYRRYALLLSFLMAAIIAPPDALSMIVIGLSIYLIYELSAIVSRIVYRNRVTRSGMPDVMGDDLD